MKPRLPLLASLIASTLLAGCITVPGPVMPLPGGGYHDHHDGLGERQRAYQNGYNDAHRDAQSRRSYNPTRNHGNIPHNLRDEYYRGYKDGYNSWQTYNPKPVQPVVPVLPPAPGGAIQYPGAYQMGYNYGRQDKLAGKDPKPGRYDSKYNNQTEGDFKRGYFAGYR